MPIDTSEEFRQETLRRKREEYKEMVRNYFGDFSLLSIQEPKLKNLSDFEKKNFKQIKIDVLRTQPDLAVFSTPHMQSMMTRILFIWAIRHPACAYV
jgi:hypothetical protein